MEKTRRVVTGINENNQSNLIAEDVVSAFVPYESFPSFQITNLFYTEDNPHSLKTRHLDTPYDINLPEGALRFITLRMPTKEEMSRDMENAGMPVPEDWTKANLHATDSADYIYVLSGKITCVVGEKLIELNQGDFLAQIGPEHTWINDNDEPCYLLCVMVGTKPGGYRKDMVTK